MNTIIELLENIDKLSSTEKIDLLKKSLVSISLNEWLILSNDLRNEFGLTVSSNDLNNTSEEEESEVAAVVSKSIFLKKLPEGLQKCFPIFKSLAQIKNSDLLTVRNELAQAFNDDSTESMEKRLIKRDVTAEEITSLTEEFVGYGTEIEVK
jgi:hypothetical protein